MAVAKILNVRVSSVLNKDVKQFGKKYLFDGQDETCWNSEKGTPQWIRVEFKEDVTISKIKIQFQGGFAGRDCFIKFESNDGVESTEKFYPEDKNSMQNFLLSKTYSARHVTINFDSSTDFYGRIVVYGLEFES